MKKFSMVVLLLLLMIVVSISGCAKKAPEMETVRCGYFPAAALLPLWVAQENGYFEDNGINHEMIEIMGSPRSIEAMAAGDIDCSAMSFVVLVMSVLQEVPVKLVASLGHGIPGAGLGVIAVLSDSPLRTLEDLEGKVIGGPMKYVESWFWMMDLLEERGIRDYQYVELEIPKCSSTLLAGTVDAAFLTESQRTLLGDKIRIIEQAGALPPGACGYCFTQKMLDEKPEVVRQWIRAMGEGVRFIQTNEVDARRIAAKYSHLPEDICLKMPLHFWDEQNRILVDQAEYELELMLKHGMIKEIPALEEICDFRFTGRTTILELHPELK